MKQRCPVLLLLIFLSASVIGYSRQNDSLAKLDKHFSMRNAFYKADYKSRDGRSGSNGADRFAIVLFHMAKRGGHGKPGRSGPTLQVKVTAIPSGDSVILAIVVTKEGGKKTDHYYVNPRHGKIVIVADGGNGGSGGNGEDGEEVTQKRPYGGSGGDGGRGANGGAGGTINVTFDSSAVSYINSPCILYFNQPGMGGNGGSGGRPTGTGSADGSPGKSGESGRPGPPVTVTGPNGKVFRIDAGRP